MASLIIIREMLGEYTTSWSERNVLIASVVAVATVVIITAINAYFSLRIIPRKNEITQQNLLIFESYILLVVSMLLIWFTGKNDSHFMIAFLLPLIPVTIQIGSYHAYLMTAILSVFVISCDFYFSFGRIFPHFLEKDIVPIAVLFLTTWFLGHYVKNDREKIAALEVKANVDGLTGLFNHRYFHNTLASEIDSCVFLNQPLSLLFLDLDSFKEFNDRFGHLSGDRILSEIARILVDNKPKEAILARYGGDEFAVILPNHSKESARLFGEKIREAVEAVDLSILVETDIPEKEKSLKSTSLTISVGIAQWDTHTENTLSLIKNADDALYRAKLFRKNRVEVYDSILDALDLELDKDDYDLLSSLQALINIINARDRYTSGHVERVVMYSKALSKKLNLDAKNQKFLSLAAYMHDIGKVNLSEQVLNKSTPLNDEEWKSVQDHSEIGANILHEVSLLADIAPLVLSHHERYDGKGYPQHLVGEEIPFLSRVLAVIDSFDAMTFDRPYKAAMNWKQAIVELRANKGTQFDPEIVELFIAVVEESLKPHVESDDDAFSSPED
jgi:diguanylate cyclase (GGDEF)-like protein